jgi:Uma2 family endonuclease
MVERAVASTLYPESDGKPMADNTIQFRWIATLVGNLIALFQDRDDVFVAGDLFWYAVEKEPDARQAPDVLVVFGRPRGDRGSYRQWEEGGIAPQVVFEILSPSNTRKEMVRKFGFYEEHGVLEYYVFNPDTNRLEIYQRQGSVFRRVRRSKEWVSPLLGIRFDLKANPMVVYGPAGRLFLTLEELTSLQLQTEKERDLARQKANQTEKERDLARQLAARLAELSRKVRRGLATAEEEAELERLENQPTPLPLDPGQ